MPKCTSPRSARGQMGSKMARVPCGVGHACVKGCRAGQGRAAAGEDSSEADGVPQGAVQTGSADLPVGQEDEQQPEGLRHERHQLEARCDRVNERAREHRGGGQHRRRLGDAAHQRPREVRRGMAAHYVGGGEAEGGSMCEQQQHGAHVAGTFAQTSRDRGDNRVTLSLDYSRHPCKVSWPVGLHALSSLAAPSRPGGNAKARLASLA